MKTLALILLSLTSYAQVSKSFIEKTIGFESTKNDTLLIKADRLAATIFEQLVLSGDYAILDDGWYGDLQSYAGDRQDVEAYIISEKDYYKDAKWVFIYTDYDAYSDWSLVLIYKFF